MKPIRDPELYLGLCEVEDLLEQKGWIKDRLKSQEGYCVQGAIDEVCQGVGLQDLWERMRRAIAMALPRPPRHTWSACATVVGFNDGPETTYDDVRRVLRKARESAL